MIAFPREHYLSSSLHWSSHRLCNVCSLFVLCLFSVSLCENSNLPVYRSVLDPPVCRSYCRFTGPCWILQSVAHYCRITGPRWVAQSTPDTWTTPVTRTTATAQFHFNLAHSHKYLYSHNTKPILSFSLPFSPSYFLSLPFYPWSILNRDHD